MTYTINIGTPARKDQADSIRNYLAEHPNIRVSGCYPAVMKSIDDDQPWHRDGFLFMFWTESLDDALGLIRAVKWWTNADLFDTCIQGSADFYAAKRQQNKEMFYQLMGVPPIEYLEWTRLDTFEEAMSYLKTKPFGDDVDPKRWLYATPEGLEEQKRRTKEKHPEATSCLLFVMVAREVVDNCLPFTIQLVTTQL